MNNNLFVPNGILKLFLKVLRTQKIVNNDTLLHWCSTSRACTTKKFDANSFEWNELIVMHYK